MYLRFPSSALSGYRERLSDVLRYPDSYTFAEKLDALDLLSTALFYNGKYEDSVRMVNRFIQEIKDHKDLLKERRFYRLSILVTVT